MDAHHDLAELNARIDALQADLASKQEIASGQKPVKQILTRGYPPT
jgi:hypothetical protein